MSYQILITLLGPYISFLDDEDKEYHGYYIKLEEILLLQI